MRKQTKVVAVASAVALLAIGASMTSFAATGWVEEDGTWYFYDNDGNRVEDTWKKSGENWYWLDSEEGGAMATEKVIEDDDDIYYVDANGVMVRNTWVKVVNEDQDEDEDPAEYHYYYMQSNGKAYKAPDTGATRFRTIDGKRYAFDADGIMLYGWVDEQSTRESDENSWKDCPYYLGNWDDGAMKTSWQKILVHDEDEDDDVEHYFHFRANGKKRYNDTDNDIKEEKINGQKYGFDYRGVMVSQWTLATGYHSEETASRASTSSWKYFRSPEDGARVSKGWFRVVAPHEDNDNVFTSNYGGTTFAKDDADDETERWYWTDGSGNIKAGEIYKIKGKYYAFRPDGDPKAGAMLSGLVLMKVDDDGKITEVIDDDVDSDDLDDLMDNEVLADNIVDKLQKSTADGVASLYYFGDEVTDGAMKTGATTVTLDGKSYHFYFSKTGGAENRGRGLTGIDDKKYIYKYGCRIEADKDDKYQVVLVTAKRYDSSGKPLSTDIQAPSGNVLVQKVESSDLRGWSGVRSRDGESVSITNIAQAQYDLNKEINESIGNENVKDFVIFYLVNTSGNIQKNKTNAKDGNDWYFYSDKNGVVKLYASDKKVGKTNITIKEFATIKTESNKK